MIRTFGDVTVDMDYVVAVHVSGDRTIIAINVAYGGSVAVDASRYGEVVEAWKESQHMDAYLAMDECWSHPMVDYVVLDELAREPSYAHEGDAGIDLRSMDTVEIAPQGTVVVGSGIAAAIPRGYVGQLVPRSGMASKRGISMANTPGTIDSGYRGEIRMALYNLGHETVTVERGERVAQLLVVPVASALLREVGSLDDTTRGDGSFGSTGSM